MPPDLKSSTVVTAFADVPGVVAGETAILLSFLLHAVSKTALRNNPEIAVLTFFIVSVFSSSIVLYCYPRGVTKNTCRLAFKVC